MDRCLQFKNEMENIMGTHKVHEFMHMVSKKLTITSMSKKSSTFPSAMYST